MLAIALPVPVIVSNFAYYYSKENGRQTGSDDDEDELEGENFPVKNGEVKKSKKKKTLGLSCIGKKSHKGERKLTQRKKKRKTGNGQFPDAKYNAIDSNPGTVRPNGLANAVNNKRQGKNENSRSSSLVETIV